MITLDLSILNQKGTPMFYSDTLALRPAFGIAGRIFIDIASPYGIYRDTGTSWQQIAVGSAGTGTITGSGTINTLAMFTPTGTAIGDSKITQSGSNINIDANVIVTNGDINLPPNNTVGGTTYAIQQVMATDDSWGIYGNTVAADQGELVFELADNGAAFNPAGQRFRFHYEAVTSGSNKDVLILDYNLSTFTTAVNVVHTHAALAGASNPYGEQINVTNTFNAGITWTALLACFNTASLQTNNWNGSATFGNASYTTNNLNLSSITFNAAGSTITNTQASGGIRAWANQILQLRIDGTNNGTYTHYANSAVYGDFASSTARFTFTNRYGYLVNDLDEYTAGHTYTNRWAFYNAGIDDNNYFAGRTSFGTNTLNSTAQLSINSTTRGFLAPRMLQAERNAIVSPATGLIVYQTDGTEGLYQYKAVGGWALIGGGGGGSMAIGGSITGATAGSVLFAGTSGVLQQDNANFFWDDTNNRLGILTTSPTTAFQVNGEMTLRNSNNQNILVSNRFLNNVWFHNNSGTITSSAQFNVAIGSESMYNVTSASRNTAVGYQSLTTITTGESNTSIGFQSMRLNSVGTLNVAIGRQALELNLASNNTAVGVNAARVNQNGTLLVAIGRQALENTTGDSNVGVGYQAGVSNTTGANNIFIGTLCVGVNATDSNRTFIGTSSTTSTYLEGNLLIGSKTDSGQKAQITGTIRINGQTAATAGGSAGLHLILNLDGTNYKIALLNV